MALVKTSNEILSVRGRFGGVYFKTGKDGKHVQPMPRSIRYARSLAEEGSFGESSSFSVVGIKGFSGASAFWHMALLGAFAAVWIAFAAYYFFTDEERERKKITGWNWYLYYALAFPETERPPFWKPPRSPGDLPAFIVTYRHTWTYEHSPAEWPDQSPSDYYWQFTTFGGKPAYLGDDRKWWLWWDGTNWVVSLQLGGKLEDFYYVSPGADIVGNYISPDTGQISSVYWGNPDEIQLPH